MAFNLFKNDAPEKPQHLTPPPKKTPLVICAEGCSAAELDQIHSSAATINDKIISPNLSECLNAVGSTDFVIAVFQPESALEQLQAALNNARKERVDGLPVLVAAVLPQRLKSFGLWLMHQAAEEQLAGLRLVIARTAGDAVADALKRCEPMLEPNVIKMPIAPEVPDTGYKYFYAISPQLRAVVRRIGELAQNNVTRIYLLGGPGSGKTSIAYYYYLHRAKGNFVTVNLSAESTGDKAAMKSLLCGHVTGAFPGASSREGALSFAKEGVCFLDESHGVTGAVMQVLMEVLENGQYMPFGATAKRILECAVLFASNRSWESLRAQINLDEHARLGATIVELTDLSTREEDLIAVLSTTLGAFSKRCTTWIAPEGVSDAGWELLRNCPWHGNIRALIRVIEAAAVDYSTNRETTGLLSEEAIRHAMDLWEPEHHESHKIYASFS